MHYTVMVFAWAIRKRTEVLIGSTLNAEGSMVVILLEETSLRKSDKLVCT